MNLWHDIPYGKKDELNVIIEIPKGSHNKYEIDKETGLIKLDRANYSDAAYPVDYGFVPQTLWDDGDALDVLILATYPIPTGILVVARPIGVVEMIDAGESDYKIIAVPIKDKRWEDVQDVTDVNKHTLKEIQHFFETYKELKGTDEAVVINGIKGKTEALVAIERSITQFQKQYPQTK